MASAFMSYSHNDEELRKELEKHLAGLHRQGVISSWHDRRIGPGEEIHGEISAHLDAADIILLLKLLWVFRSRRYPVVDGR